MNAIILNGSLRKNGRTAAVTSFIANALNAAGTDAEEHFLYHMGIKGCLTCGYGAGRNNAVELVKKLLSSDIVIFAGPIYMEHLADPLNAFIEMLYYTCRGEDDALSKMENKKIAAALTMDGDESAAHDAVRSLRSLSEHFGSNFVSALSVPFADIEKINVSECRERMQKFVDEILK